MQHLLGAFPHSGLLRGSATLDQNEDSPLVGTWRVVFLGEIEPRAARPGMLPRRVRRVGPRIVPAVKSPRWPPLSHGPPTNARRLSPPGRPSADPFNQKPTQFPPKFLY